MFFVVTTMAATRFLESSWQRSVEVVFWTLVVFAGDLGLFEMCFFFFFFFYFLFFIDFLIFFDIFFFFKNYFFVFY